MTKTYRAGASLLVLGSLASAELVELWWNVTYVLANPDGHHLRRVIGVNDTWPPPPIDIHSTDRLRLHVYNSLDEPTTVHLHGMFLAGINYFDGAARVTQCGIPPGQTFTYDVPYEKAGQWGTYWAHGHYTGQAIDGLKTPFIIHPSTEPYRYDHEYTVILSDWYHDERPQLLNQFLNKANPTGAEPVPNSALIYFAENGMYLSGFNDEASLVFEPGKTYRLRVINAAAFAAFFFRIDGHRMRIIEADGTDVQEHEAEYLSIAAAQRYSVLVTALDAPKGNYLIHADSDLTMFDDIPEANFYPNATARLNYSDTLPQAPESPAPSAYEDFDDMQLVPLVHNVILAPTQIIPLEVLLETMDNGINRGMFNSITWNPPLTPTLFTALSMGKNATYGSVYGPGTHVLQYGDIVQLEIINMDDNSHPFHLHGHKFAIVSRSDNIDEENSFKNKVENALWRDTIQIPGQSKATVRFVADNPGAWMFHCHLEWHLESGLALTFIEAPTEMQSSIHPPTYVVDQCATLGFPTSGNAAGRHDLNDLSGLPLGPHRQTLGWTPKAIAAISGCVVAALSGMTSVGLYAFGFGLSREVT